MKLSVITDEISMDFEHALDIMQEYGCEGAELRSLWGTNIVDLSDDQIERAKRALDARGMAVSCIASPLFKCDLDETGGSAAGRTHQAQERGLGQQMDVLERCIHLCGVFDTPFIRIFAFWRRGDLADNIEKEIIRIFEEPAARAEKANVVLGLENEHSCYLGTGGEIARVIEAVNSPGLRAVWDPGNAFCAGEVPYPDGYEAVKDYIVHVHIKDAVREDGKHKFVCIGDGELDYDGQLRALVADGYDGYLSLETHYKPGGVSEDGSRQCLASLKEMLQAINA